VNELHETTAQPRQELVPAFDVLLALAKRWKVLLLLPILAGGIAVAGSYLIAPTFTARTSFLPPQQQNSAVGALASLGALASVAGGAAGLRTPADQFVALMQSTTVLDKMIERFDLIKLYEVDLRVDARRNLGENSRVALNKRDGLISVEVDDLSPQRATDMANAYVEELRRLSSTLAISEAQVRRSFFERQLTQTRDKMAAAQVALQASGFNAGALKSEPRAAAEAFAKLRAEATAAEVRLQALRGALVDGAPEVVQQQAVLSALRSQVLKMENETDKNVNADYIGRYREFKYQETLFELFSRQYELARVDEAREGALFQVVDAATLPERKSRPKRAMIGIGTTLAALSVLLVWVLGYEAWLQMRQTRQGAHRLAQLRQALGRG
jgi:uncharacterized protein involved in exopolysaccharide biosynthesis